MIHALLLGVLACGAGPAEIASDLKAYEVEAAKVGRDANANVKLALWCEAHGLTAERLKHLAIAVVNDPANVTARGLMGLVADGGKWRRPEDVARRVREDERLATALAEYNARRAKTPNTADAQWRLALWCEENGLQPEAKAHLGAVLRLDPNREAARKRLGFKRHDGRWMTDEQIAGQKAEARAQEKADRHWKARLDTLKNQLQRAELRAEAEAALGEVTDPRAVPAVMRAFARDGRRLVQVLGQIDSPAATRSLAALAVFSASPDVRRSAAETLKRRDPREYLDRLIGLVRKQIRYEVRPVGGPNDPGGLYVEGKRFNLQRYYTAAAQPRVQLQPGDRIEFDADGLPVIDRFLGYDDVPLAPGQLANLYRPQKSPNKAQIEKELNKVLGPDFSASQKDGLAAALAASGNGPLIVNENPEGVDPRTASAVSREARVAKIPVGRMAVEAQRSAAVAERQLEADVASIEAQNRAIQALNDRVLPMLGDVTGQDLGADPEAWRAWWTNEQGYALAPSSTAVPPTFVQTVVSAYQPQVAVSVVDIPTNTIIIQRRHSCFGAGTLVQTLEGRRPIEVLQAGDRVLTQDTRSGALGYQPVLAVYHNPPNRTLRLSFEAGRDVVCTGIHRLWKVGRGWVMARDLKPGDTIRTVGATARVKEVSDDRVQPVFNLEVAEGHSFFVGEAGLLAHDNSLVLPVAEPFDAAAEQLAAAGHAGP